MVIGTKNAFIFHYNLKENRHNICTPFNKEKLSPISAIDISYDEELIICGYLNGYIALYDLSTSKIIKYFYSIHSLSSSILALKFYHNNTKSTNKCKIISSDNEGKVYKSIFEKSFLNVMNLESFPVIEKNAGNISEIKILKSFILNSSESTKNLKIVALASNLKVCVIQIEPKHSVIYVIPRPNFIKEIYVPSISWDEGFFKYHQENSQKKQQEKSIFLLISWEKYIDLLVFKEKYNAEDDCFNLTSNIVGCLKVSSPCIYVGFISINIIAGITENFDLFFLHLDDINESNESCIKTDNIKEDYFHEIKPVMRIHDKLLKLQFKTEINYEKLLISSKKEESSLFFLDQDDNFEVLEIYSWQNYINKLLENDKKLAIFKLYQIYEYGNLDFIALIPKVPKFRKKTMKEFVKLVLKNFLTNNLDFEKREK